MVDYNVFTRDVSEGVWKFEFTILSLKGLNLSIGIKDTKESGTTVDELKKNC